MRQLFERIFRRGEAEPGQAWLGFAIAMLVLAAISFATGEYGVGAFFAFVSLPLFAAGALRRLRLVGSVERAPEGVGAASSDPFTEVARAVADLEDLYDGLRVGDVDALLRQDDFQRAADSLAAPDRPLEDAVRVIRRDARLPACVALEAIARRDDGGGAASAVLHELWSFDGPPRFFALRALERADGPIVEELVFSIDEDWISDEDTLALLREFVRARVAGGEEITFERTAGRIGPVASAVVDALGDALPEAAREQFRSRRVATEALNLGLGKIIGKPDGADGGLVTTPPVAARVDELDTAVRGGRRSVLLVGEPGVGKTSIVRLLAERMTADGWTVIEATAADFIAGKIFIGEIEGYMERLAESVRGSRVAIVIPSFEQTLWAGQHRYSPSGLLDLLLPRVAAGELTLIGEVTPAALERLVLARPQVRTAFELVPLPALGEAETLELAREWTRAGGAAPTDAVLGEALELARQYLPEAALPGPVLRLLRAAREEVDDGAAPTYDDLMAALSRLTGIPRELLDDRVSFDLEGARRLFSERVLGQPEAVDVLVERLALIKAGLTDPSRPLGVFLFVGPTGTGKTELAKTLAELLFGSERRLLRLDMSEFKAEESLRRLFGDHDRGPEATSLAEAIRRQPFSVVLLDEFEKAHPAVWDIFLQVFDDGRLTDEAGNVADFRHAIIIMTSNLGTSVARASLGFGAQPGESFSAAGIERAVARAFRPELRNRIDRIVVFRPLSRPVMRMLLEKELADVLQRRGLRRRTWAVEWDESALEFLLEAGFSPDLGARPLKRAVEQHVLAPLAKAIATHQVPEGDQFLFVHAPTARRLQVVFIDPDAPSPEGPLPPRAEGRPELEEIVLEPDGSAAELEVLERCVDELAAEIEGEPWQQSKREAFAEIAAPGFWDSPERFPALARAERLDRIEGGLKRARSLLRRLGEPGPGRRGRPAGAELVRRVASQLYVTRVAARALAAGEPLDALLVVERPRSRNGSAAAAAFVEKLVAMYRAWAERCGMRMEAVGEPARADGRLAFAVAGLGAYSLLRPEAGFHVWEEPEPDGGYRRIQARVLVVPQPDDPAAAAEQAQEFVRGKAAAADGPPAVVRRYRERPSPLVRDAVRGWRTGRLDRVLDGDFDLLS